MERTTTLINNGDEPNRNYLSLVLQTDVFSIQLAASGKEGMINAWIDRPDFFAVDPKLPDISGLDLVTRFCTDHLNPLLIRALD